MPVNILETRLHRTMLFIVNIVALSLLLVATSLLIVTAFPALAAAFGVVRDWIGSQHTDVLRPFIRHFIANLRHSLVIGILWILMAASLVMNLQLSGQLTPVAFRVPVLIVAVALVIAFLGVSVFVLPVLVHYDVGWRGAVRNAVYFMAGQPAVAVACLWIVAATALVAWVLPITLAFTAALSTYGVYRTCEVAFAGVDRQRSTSPDQPHEGATGREWSLNTEPAGQTHG